MSRHTQNSQHHLSAKSAEQSSKCCTIDVPARLGCVCSLVVFAPHALSVLQPRDDSERNVREPPRTPSRLLVPRFICIYAHTVIYVHGYTHMRTRTRFRTVHFPCMHSLTWSCHACMRVMCVLCVSQRSVWWRSCEKCYLARDSGKNSQKFIPVHFY